MNDFGTLGVRQRLTVGKDPSRVMHSREKGRWELAIDWMRPARWRRQSLFTPESLVERILSRAAGV